MPMTRFEELEHQIRRDRQNTMYTAVLVIAVIVLIVVAWLNP